jgi:ABC-2 type transport system permease protein
MSVDAGSGSQERTLFLPAWLPIVWEELVTWRNHVWMHLISYMLSPLIFLLSFGLGVSQGIKMIMPGGMSYLGWLVPGVVALALFNNGLTTVMTRMFYARLYYKSFDSYRLAPAGNLSILFGYTLSGMLRGLISGSIVLVAVNFIVPLRLNPAFIADMMLASMCFASFAVLIGLHIRNFDDQSLVNELILVPLTYLSGTLIPVERLPGLLQPVVWCFPLAPAAQLLRDALAGGSLSTKPLLFLAGWTVLFFILGLYRLNRLDA